MGGFFIKSHPQRGLSFNVNTLPPTYPQDLFLSSSFFKVFFEPSSFHQSETHSWKKIQNKASEAKWV
jgi:hypothetical protein